MENCNCKCDNKEFSTTITVEKSNISANYEILNNDLTTPDLLIGIPTYNNTLTLTASMKRLLLQNIVPNVLIYDLGSNDGTPEMIEIQIKNHFFSKMKLELKRDNLSKLGKTVARQKSREKIAEIANTKYIMFLDADVLLPHFCILPMLEELGSDDKLAMISLIYEPVSVSRLHIQLGASILKTEIAKQLKYDLYRESCTCSNVQESIDILGYKSKHDTRFLATHLEKVF